MPKQQSYQNNFSGNSRRRRRRQKTGLFLMFLLLVALILGVAYLVVKIAAILFPQEKQPEDFTPKETLQELVDELDPTFLDGQTNEVGKEKKEEGPLVQEIDAAALTNPDFRMIALPENGCVDMSYFDDVTFLGDSLTQGFPIYNDNTFPHSKYAAWKGCSPRTLLQNQMQMEDGTTVNAVDYVATTLPGKLYILLGTNAITGQTNDVIMKYYEQLVDTLGERLPGTLIYIQSIPTATAEETVERAKKGQDFSIERINELNDQLAKMAYVRNLSFINLQEFLCGDDGYLKHEYAAGDGVHLNPSGYRAWRDYLLRHTVHRWDNPYLLGSPYYDPAADDAWMNGDLSATPMGDADAIPTPVFETPVEQPAESVSDAAAETPAEAPAG